MNAKCLLVATLVVIVTVTLCMPSNIDDVINEPLNEKLERIKTEFDEVIITTATESFKEFLENWMCSVKKLRLLHHVLVYTVDASLAKYLVEELNFVNVYLDEQNSVEENTGLNYGTKEYRMLMARRTDFIRDVLVGMNYRVLLVDNDAVWLNGNPLQFIRENYRDMDIVGQDDSKYQITKSYSTLCGGFLYLNNTEAMKSTWHTVAVRHDMAAKNERRKSETEQYILNVHKSYINFAALPWNYFPNGNTYFNNTEVEPSAFDNVLVIHNNWVIGKENKRSRFTSQPGKLWLLDNDGHCLNDDNLH